MKESCEYRWQAGLDSSHTDKAIENPVPQFNIHSCFAGFVKSWKYPPPPEKKHDFIYLFIYLRFMLWHYYHLRFYSLESSDT
jgi:hypothetical protein